MSFGCNLGKHSVLCGGQLCFQEQICSNLFVNVQVTMSTCCLEFFKANELVMPGARHICAWIWPSRLCLLKTREGLRQPLDLAIQVSCGGMEEARLAFAKKSESHPKPVSLAVLQYFGQIP